MNVLNTIITVVTWYWTANRHEISEQKSCHIRASGYPESHWLVYTPKDTGFPLPREWRVSGTAVGRRD